MGYSTDFVGHIDIAPALNEAEISYLEAFTRSRRFDRPGGPYEVAANPWAESSDGFGEAYTGPAPGQPQLWCQWSVCWQGCCLAYDGMEKFYAPVPWMRYLIDHFLMPGATASTSGDPQFDDFSFDHVLDGMIVGCRRDTKQLFSIEVVDNELEEWVWRPGNARYGDLPPLPYEEVIDRDREARQSRGERSRQRRAMRKVPRGK